MGSGDEYRPPRAPERPSPPFAAKELLERGRLDFVGHISSEEAQWDYLVGMSLCEEYGIELGAALLTRWFETGPSVAGKRATEYVEAIKAGREIRERVTVAKRGYGSKGGDDS
jgi:hypothetical protein